jgi:AbrB family looped-hinge helix DNA binding protein
MNVIISQKGWVVIPAALRKKYGLKPGSNMQIVDYGGVFAMVPVIQDPINDGAGMLKGKTKLSNSIIEEHRKERELENK